MRFLGKKRDDLGRDSAPRLVRITEPTTRRQASDPKSGLMLLGERVADATTK
jgi:hypothetical protein